MNCDGLFTITDANLWLEWLFFLPADGLTWALMQWQPDAAVFLELTPDAYSGWGSGFLSVFLWLVLWIVGGLLWFALEETVDKFLK